ncbi:hypothetical protein GS462_26910 [Rhodococcus hoagii]|nr:hypothetical protein [Prescottella equi]
MTVMSRTAFTAFTVMATPPFSTRWPISNLFDLAAVEVVGAAAAIP